MAQIAQWVQSLEGTDFFTLVLPFLLVFAIVFGLVMALGLFGDKDKPVAAIIAFVAGMYFIQNQALADSISENLSALFGAFAPLLIIGLIIGIALAMGGLSDLDDIWYLGAALALGALIIAWQAGMFGEAFGVTAPGGEIGGIVIGDLPFSVPTLIAMLLALGMLIWLVINGGE